MTKQRAPIWSYLFDHLEASGAVWGSIWGSFWVQFWAPGRRAKIEPKLGPKNEHPIRTINLFAKCGARKKQPHCPTMVSENYKGESRCKEIGVRKF